MKLSTSNARRLLKRFDEAAQEFAFVGAAHPDDAQGIIDKYDKAKAKLLEFMMTLVVNEP